VSPTHVTVTFKFTAQVSAFKFCVSSDYIKSNAELMQIYILLPHITQAACTGAAGRACMLSASAASRLLGKGRALLRLAHAQANTRAHTHNSKRDTMHPDKHAQKGRGAHTGKHLGQTNRGRAGQRRRRPAWAKAQRAFAWQHGRTMRA
jgi:hypothetical protein